MKTYCTQNRGDCMTCSLSNYNRDCHNDPIEDWDSSLIADADDRYINRSKVTMRSFARYYLGKIAGFFHRPKKGLSLYEYFNPKK